MKNRQQSFTGVPTPIVDEFFLSFYLHPILHYSDWQSGCPIAARGSSVCWYWILEIKVRRKQTSSLCQQEKGIMMTGQANLFVFIGDKNITLAKHVVSNISHLIVLRTDDVWFSCHSIQHYFEITFFFFVLEPSGHFKATVTGQENDKN